MAPRDFVNHSCEAPLTLLPGIRRPDLPVYVPDARAGRVEWKGSISCAPCAIDKAIDMTPDSRKPTEPDAGQPSPDVDHLSDALDHISSAVETNSIASGAAKGLVYSIIETLGTLVGDPDLPEHARSGYEGLLETAREIRARIEGGPH